MAFFGVKLYIVLVAALMISSCSAKFNGFMEFDGLSETDVKHSNLTVCEYCNRVVAFWDKHSPPETTPEKLAANIKGVICKDVLPGSIDEQLCKAMAGKEDVFAKAYFDHQKDDKINPCKVTHIC